MLGNSFLAHAHALLFCSRTLGCPPPLPTVILFATGATLFATGATLFATGATLATTSAAISCCCNWPSVETEEITDFTIAVS